MSGHHLCPVLGALLETGDGSKSLRTILVYPKIWLTGSSIQGNDPCLLRALVSIWLGMPLAKTRAEAWSKPNCSSIFLVPWLWLG